MPWRTRGLRICRKKPYILGLFLQKEQNEGIIQGLPAKRAKNRERQQGV